MHMMPKTHTKLISEQRDAVSCFKYRYLVRLFAAAAHTQHKGEGVLFCVLCSMFPDLGVTCRLLKGI